MGKVVQDLPFFLIYILLAIFVYILLFPFLLLSIFSQKHKSSVYSRFFLFRNLKFKKENRVWFHACSLGEVKSLAPFVQELGDVSISTTTQAGYTEARKLTSDAKYLPFELLLPFWITKHKILVVTEAELWYMLFFIAKLKGMKTILINARISDNSYHRYKRVSILYKYIFRHIDVVLAQSSQDKLRLEKLGATNVKVMGNIKTLQKIKVIKTYIKSDKRVITLASTHKNEEKLILDNIDFDTSMQIIVAPRHPQRFNEVETMLIKFTKDKNLSFSKLSEDEGLKSDIVLVDKLGELINIYNISDDVILGGSFVLNIGGHNPLEPAFFHLPILSGKYYFNQKILYSLVDNIQIINEKEIQTKLNTKLKTSINSKSNIDEFMKFI